MQDLKKLCCVTQNPLSLTRLYMWYREFGRYKAMELLKLNNLCCGGGK